MKDRIWLSFDLGFGGDQEGMYRWLTAHGARECGPALATLRYAYQEDLVAELKEDLASALDLHPGDRVYLIYKDPYDGEVTGLFIFGRRAVRQDAAIHEPQALTRLH